jgi:hypothetical protein
MLRRPCRVTALVGELYDPALGMELLPVTGIDHHVPAGIVEGEPHSL